MTSQAIPHQRRSAFAVRYALCAVVIVAGCGTDPLNRNPQLSGMVVDGETIPEARVSVPMPAPEPTVIAQRAERTSLWQSGSRGFFGDKRAERVGDLLTILIEIDDEADLRNRSQRSREGRTTVDDPEFFGYGDQLGNVLPNVDAVDLPAGDPLVDLASSSSAEGDGSINRREEINLKVAALVIDELPNGNLVVAGRQEVKVNFELRELRVAGIIRPVDIQMNNTIPYEKIAEARISYGGKGQLTRVQQPKYGQDALEVVLPY